MKKFLNCFYASCLIIISLFFISCGGAESGTIEAYVGINCGGSVNHDGDDVYAYNAADIFFTQSIQAGGHTNGSTTDLGINIFNGNSLVEEGEYTINAGGGEAGTAYVFFQPTRESGYEFISQDNQGVVRVINAAYTSDIPPLVSLLDIEFDNVMMTNFNTGQDTCIGSFKLHVE